MPAHHVRPANQHPGAFVREANTALQVDGTNAAILVAKADPRNLVRTQHPRRGIRGIVGFVHEVGSVHVDIGGVCIQLLATVLRRRGRVFRVIALVFVVHQHILLAVFWDEIAHREHRDLCSGRPLAEIFSECEGELAHAERSICQLP